MTTEKREASINNIVRNDKQILAALLVDRTLSGGGNKRNISWATDDYGFPHDSQITADQIFEGDKGLILPRIFKHPTLQASRSKYRAEVFTPAWVCNAQNNLVDQQWFGRKDVFNRETTLEDGSHSWVTNDKPVEFSADRPWMHYLRAPRLEMACGEGPYLVSRYDTTTGVAIDIGDRIGITDRKFRVILENTPSENTKMAKRQFLRKAYQALQATYGFDWQGDNVFLTREQILLSFCEYYHKKWQRLPNRLAILKAAEIISWNIWQMDATTFSIPNTSTLCDIMEWHGSDPLKGKTIKFSSLVGKRP